MTYEVLENAVELLEQILSKFVIFFLKVFRLTKQESGLKANTTKLLS